MSMLPSLFVAEHDGENFSFSTLYALAQLTSRVDLLIIGKDPKIKLNLQPLPSHVRRICWVEEKDLATLGVDQVVDLIQNIEQPYDHIVAGWSAWMSQVFAYLAVKRGQPLQVISEAQSTIQRDGKSVVLFAPTIQALNAFQAKTGPLSLHKVASSPQTSAGIKTQLRPFQQAVDLSKASLVIGLGCGIKDVSLLPRLQAVASALHAVIGGTSEMIDRGWMPATSLIGWSGQVVSPRLYVAIGVSGTVQHLKGIDHQTTILAINPDPAAPIWHTAALGWQTTIEQALPRIESCLLLRKNHFIHSMEKSLC
jgi:electron transfer flavoprotein alpha subunit